MIGLAVAVALGCALLLARLEAWPSQVRLLKGSRLVPQVKPTWQVGRVPTPWAHCQVPHMGCTSHEMARGDACVGLAAGRLRGPTGGGLWGRKEEVEKESEATAVVVENPPVLCYGSQSLAPLLST